MQLEHLVRSFLPTSELSIRDNFGKSNFMLYNSRIINDRLFDTLW